MAHPLLERAAQHTAQARAINDEFEGKDMPAEAARQMQAHLAKATDYRARVTREAQLKATEDWIAEPQYKHDMTGGSDVATDFGHGSIMLESEKKHAERSAFFDFIRKGESGLRMEQKAALVEDSDGNKLIPADFAGTIYKGLPNETVMRGICYVRPTSKRTVDIGEVIVSRASWGKLELGDTAADGLGTPPADKQTITVWDLNALVKLGVDELDDSDENLEELIRSALAAEIGVQEDEVFAVGTGDAAKQPTGIANGSTVAQKVTAAAIGTYTSDDIIKLEFAVPQRARRGASYVGNSDAEQAVRLLKGTDGHYMWQENFRTGGAPTLNGKPWFTNDGFASGDGTTTAGKPLFFGNFNLGYMIADRRQLGVTRLAERFADEGKVGLLFRHRVGGGLVRPKALAYYAV
jgi:HK97 family phage major capsid protein